MIIHDLDIDVYHADRDSISKTGLDMIDKCPAIYHAWQSPDAPARVAKPGQLEGHLAHCAILEPSEFGNRYGIPPKSAPRKPTEAQWNAKSPSQSSIDAMAWWTDFNAENMGKEMISAEQYEVAMRQADSVRALPEVREALGRGAAEVSAFWTDPETGVKCRCRPDWNHPCGDSGVILLDVKTFSDVGEHEFTKQVARKAYAKQDAMYSDGFEIASGLEVLAFIFVAVSMDYPYSAAAYMLDGPSKDAGRRHYHRNLSTYAECVKSGVWPGYGNDIKLISLPNWALSE